VKLEDPLDNNPPNILSTVIVKTLKNRTKIIILLLILDVMKINLITDGYIPNNGIDFSDIKTALVEFVFEKVSPKSQPEFIEQFVNDLILKRNLLKQDLDIPISTQKLSHLADKTQKVH
jgi:hypothetical protein